MNRFLTPLVALAMMVMIPLANAAETKQVCAKYKKSFNEWSDSYQVNAKILDGSELNEKTDCMFCYESLSKYVVIFWSNGGASVIELDSPFLSIVGSEGIDQNGKTWEVSESSGYCL